MTAAFDTLAELARDAFSDLMTSSDEREIVIERVLDLITDPDVEMLIAGAEVLARALPGMKAGERRDLAEAVWRAMLARVEK